MHGDSIIDDSDCEKLKKIIGKSSKNEMYFIITGTPKKCDNFVGLGIFVMLNPMPNGRPYPFKNNNQFRGFKKDIVEQIGRIMDRYMVKHNLGLAKNNFTYRKLVEGDDEPEPLLERSLQESFYMFSIKSHFTQLSEIVELERYYDNEWLMEIDIKRALKYLFSFVVSQYKENIGVVDDKSSESTLISQSDSSNNEEYESWMVDHAITLIPLTLILGAVIACMTFFIHKRNNDAYMKKKKAIFNQGIQVLYDIRKEMDRGSEMITDSESVTTETSTY
uniref:CASPASE_P20 domain-containing protein n=1 Tax=Strongyloides venezuelensis TaxID=75913 RepID=A0A0K0FP47_STRVS